MQWTFAEKVTLYWKCKQFNLCQWIPGKSPWITLCALNNSLAIRDAADEVISHLEEVVGWMKGH